VITKVITIIMKSFSIHYRKFSLVVILILAFFTYNSYIKLILPTEGKMAQKPGGLGNVKPADATANEVATQIKHDIEAKAGATYSHFAVTEYATQVVAGTNYFLKIDVGGGHFIHARVFKDLSQHYSVHSVQTNKTASDHLDYF